MLHGARLPAVGLGLCHELALLELTVAFPSSHNAVKPIVFAALLKFSSEKPYGDVVQDSPSWKGQVSGGLFVCLIALKTEL